MIENARDNAYTYISVDVNGYNKKPNRFGQDLFMFQINSAGKLVPMGAEETYYRNCSFSETNSMNSAGCTIKALTDKNFFKYNTLPNIKTEIHFIYVFRLQSTYFF